MKKNIFLVMFLLSGNSIFAMEHDVENPQAATPKGSPIAERRATNESDPLASLVPPDSGILAPTLSGPSLSPPITAQSRGRTLQQSGRLRSCWECCCVPDDHQDITFAQFCSLVSGGLIFVAGMTIVGIMRKNGDL